MDILDDLKKIKKIDKSGVLSSIEALGKQARMAWGETKKIRIPQDYRNVRNILINGMGGSALGGRIIQSLFFDKLSVPLQVINSYTLPEYADKDTLYILSSYSGMTEEILNTGKEVLGRNLKCLGITTGGLLGEFLKKHSVPVYIIDGKFNPCGRPRMGLVYSIVGQIGLLKQAGLLKIKDEEMKSVFKVFKVINEKYGVKKKKGENPAKKIASSFYNKIPVLIGAEFLSGSVHTFRNCLNENSKNFCDYFLISELNHHLMEGLKHPYSNKDNLVFLFMNSDLFLPRIRERFILTKDVVLKNNISVIEYSCFSKTKLSQCLEMVHLGFYVSFYLAVLYNQDPEPLPWVDYFKKSLK